MQLEMSLLFPQHLIIKIIEFEENNKIYRVCRYGDDFALIEGKTLRLFDSVSELKRYWTKHIFKLPEIVKNQASKIVDPVLFFQLFFVGQDKKDTSNISHSTKKILKK